MDTMSVPSIQEDALHCEPYYNSPRVTESHRRLYAAVIRQAVTDLWKYRYKLSQDIYATHQKDGESDKAFSRRKSTRRSLFNREKMYHDDAARWFRRESYEYQGFGWCCDLLRLNRCVVRQQALDGPPEGYRGGDLA